MMILTEKEGPGWKVPEYLIMAVHLEFNVWSRFKNRYLAIVRGKEQTKEEIKDVREADKFADINDGANLLVKTKNVLELTKEPDAIPHDSIDYVFTDPPYGGSIQYYELDMIRAAWLQGPNKDPRFASDWWRDEITINVGQGKDLEYYQKLLNTSFSEIYSVLKPNRWMTVTFHNTNIEIYNSVIKSAVLAGFILEKIVYQPPDRPSLKEQAAPYASAVGDYYIRFRKPERSIRAKEITTDKARFERTVLEAARKIIAERGEPTPLTHLLTMYSMLDQEGVLLSAQENISDVLKKYLDKEFVIVDKKWWLKNPEKHLLHVIPLSERVEKAIINTLNKQIKCSFDDILRVIYVTFQNALTPSQNIKIILEHYAEKTKDGKWRLKTSELQRQNEHNEIVKKLAELGKRFDFMVYADITEYRNSALPANEKRVDRLKEIDVIWFSSKGIEYIFEVENTTGITEAIIRGSNIERKGVRKFILIPEERKYLLERKLSETALRERIDQDNWKFIYYLTFFNELLKPKVKLEDLEKLALSADQIKKEKQASMLDFQ